MDDLYDAITITLNGGRADVSVPDTLPVAALPRLEQLVRAAVGREVVVGRHEHLCALMRGAIVQAVQQMIETGMLYERDGEWLFRDAVKQPNGT